MGHIEVETPEEKEAFEQMTKEQEENTIQEKEDKV